MRFAPFWHIYCSHSSVLDYNCTNILYKNCSKLYALDTTLDLENPTKAKLEEAMKGHIIEKTEYIGTFAAKSA